MLRQLSDQDASYLYVETIETPVHVGGISLIELPADYHGQFFDDYKAQIANRLRHIPFMHQKLARLPLDLDRPFWVEDDQFDIDYHVRHETAPSPGGMADLEALIALLHATPLDRTRPLWEFYLIDGLASGQLAVYTKIHHTALDGASSQALITTMYDPSPAPRSLPPPPGSDRASERTDPKQLVDHVITHAVDQGIQAASLVPELIGAWGDYLVSLSERMVRHDPSAALPDLSALSARPHTPRSIFNVGITNQRVFAARTLPFPAIRQISKLTHTKINDVVLCLCSSALRGYLADRSELPAESLTASIPISLRGDADATEANHNGIFLCSLASDIADPYDRLLAISQSSATQRRQIERIAKLPRPDVRLIGVSDAMRRAVEDYGRSPLVDWLPLFGNLTISNVPGPRTPLYIAGAKVLSIYPCSIPFHGAALNITVQSYGDRLDTGLVACRKAVPDLAQLADRLEPALAELGDAVARHTAPATPHPTPQGNHHGNHRNRRSKDRRNQDPATAARSARDARKA